MGPASFWPIFPAISQQFPAKCAAGKQGQKTIPDQGLRALIIQQTYRGWFSAASNPSLQINTRTSRQGSVGGRHTTPLLMTMRWSACGKNFFWCVTSTRVRPGKETIPYLGSRFLLFFSLPDFSNVVSIVSGRLWVSSMFRCIPHLHHILQVLIISHSRIIERSSISESLSR